MELASVTRLFKDQSTQKSVLLLEAVATREKFKINIPSHRAGILALEGHGLNDRCGIYGIMSECVERLRGSFASVVVTLDKSRGVSASISLSQGEDLTWITADVVELVAFALHVQLPIFLDVTDESNRGQSPEGEAEPERENPDLPAVFENVLSEIMGPKPENSPASVREEQPRADNEFPLDPVGG